MTLRMTFGKASSGKVVDACAQRAPLGAAVARGTCATKTVKLEREMREHMA